MYNTVEPLYSGHPWDKYKCPDYRGVLISGVNLYYKAQFGTFVSVLNTGVSSFQGVLSGGASLYIHVHCTCIYILYIYIIIYNIIIYDYIHGLLCTCTCTIC